MADSIYEGLVHRTSADPIEVAAESSTPVDQACSISKASLRGIEGISLCLLNTSRSSPKLSAMYKTLAPTSPSYRARP